MTGSMRGMAIRNPVRGKAHRPDPVRERLGMALLDTACGRSAEGMTESVHVRQCAPEDLCVRCWRGEIPL